MKLSFEDARHLLARTGFGGSPTEIDRVATMDREVAVDYLFEGITERAVTSPPQEVLSAMPPPQGMKGMTDEQKKTFRQERNDEALALKGWWYQELLSTPSPLTERMTLFWHDHFTSGYKKVKWPALLYRQNLLLRRNALGSFRDLLFEIAKDSAMMLYLDTQTNRKDHPNENFARELFELFTLGEGQYTEQDIKEAARAFTGWHVAVRHGGEFVFHQHQHDSGVKRVLGRVGAFGGDDILSIILDQPGCARHITTRLWLEFISDQPDSHEVERLAVLFRANDYHMRPLLRALLVSPQSWAPESRGVLVKSPVELLVGTGRLFQWPIQETEVLVKYGRRLGQDLFDPPNVKGWPGGTRWITSTTILARWQLLQRSLRGAESGMHQPQGAGISMAHGLAWVAQDSLDRVQAVLTALPPVTPIRDVSDRWQAVQQLVMDPVYQLK